MKKLISLILALGMVMGLSVTAFAADQTGVGTGDYTADVTGTYVAGTTGNGTVYSVDIAWEGMSFTYHAEKAPVWDVTKHEYSVAVPAYWEEGNGTITVTNHSNAFISVAPSYAAEEGYMDAKMQFNTKELFLDTAETNQQAITGMITVTPSGSLPSTANSTKIGAITVKITAEGATGRYEIYDLTDSKDLEWCITMMVETHQQIRAGIFDAYDTTAAEEAYAKMDLILSPPGGGGITDYPAAYAALFTYYNEMNKLEAQLANDQ